MDRPAQAQFILNQTIQHPPYFILTGQYIEDDDAPLQFFIECRNDVAQELWQYANIWAKRCQGESSSLSIGPEKSHFSVTIPAQPILPSGETAQIKVGAYSLASANALIWIMAKCLRSNRGK